jgi:hypothetical protein
VTASARHITVETSRLEARRHAARLPDEIVVAVAAVANKLARIIWVILSRRQVYRGPTEQEHASSR